MQANSAPRRKRIAAQALDAVRPVAFAAEHAQHDDPRTTQRALDIEIDRRRMAERQQIGQPHARKILGKRGMRGAERRKIAVGGRQHDDVGGGLPEIAGDLAVVDDCRSGRASDACCFDRCRLPGQRAADRVAVETLSGR